MIDLIVKNIPTIATIGFVIGFAYIIYNVFFKTSKKEHDDHSKIPLKDED